MHAAKQMFYLNKEARQTCTMDTSGTWLKEVGPASRCMTCATTACCCCTCVYSCIITKVQDLSMHPVNDESNLNPRTWKLVCAKWLPSQGICKQRPVATINSWIAGACSKGCQGPLLHTVLRYGALGCRFTGPSEEVQHDSCVVKKKQSRWQLQQAYHPQVTNEMQQFCFVLFGTKLLMSSKLFTGTCTAQ